MSKNILSVVFIGLFISQVFSLSLDKIKNEVKSLKFDYTDMTDQEQVSRPKRYFHDQQLEKLFDIQSPYHSNMDLLEELRSAYANNIQGKRDEVDDTTTTTETPSDTTTTDTDTDTTTDKPQTKKVLDETTRNIISDILSSFFEISGGLVGGTINYISGGLAGLLSAVSDTLKQAMPTSTLITPIIDLISVAWSSLINISGISNSLLYGIIGETVSPGGSIGSELIAKGTSKGTKLIEEALNLGQNKN